MRRGQIQGGVRSTGGVNQNAYDRPFSLTAAAPIRAGEREGRAGNPLSSISQEKCSENCQRGLHIAKVGDHGPHCLDEVKTGVG